MFDSKLLRSGMLGLVLLCASQVSALAQIVPPPQQKCYDVILQRNEYKQLDGPLLVNHCTGSTWLFIKIFNSDGSYTYRWFPIGVAEHEFVISNSPVTPRPSVPTKPVR